MLLIKLTLFTLIAYQSSATNPFDSKGAQKIDTFNYDDPTSYFRDRSIQKVFDGHISFDDYLSYSLKSLKQIAGYDNDLHRYDSNNDLINSFERNLSYSDDLNKFRVHIDVSESSLLEDQSELTLIENEKNQAACGAHLDILIKESQKLYANFETFSSSKQLNLINFLDSFGSPSTQLLEGNSMWLGSLEQCHKSRINVTGTGSDDDETSGARYCIANFRSPNWVAGSIVDLIADKSGSQSIKLGVCLPESCNTISILRHKTLIDSLVKINRLTQVPYSSYQLTHLFCLPDETSPLRQFSYSAKLFILILSSWLTLVLYISLKYEYSRMIWILANGCEGDNTFEQLEKTNCVKIFAFRLSWSKLFEANNQTRSFILKKDGESDGGESHSTTGGIENRVFNLESEQESGIDSSDSETNSVSERKIQQSIILRSSSNPTIKQMNIIDSLKTVDLLLNQSLKTNKAQSFKINHNHIQQSSIVKEESSAVVLVNNNQSTIRQNNNQQSSKQQIDLSAIDGIKVISMVWLISAHTLLFFIRTIVNGRDFWSILRDGRFMTIMAGIFPVDTFFTITGILTAFLKFNKNNGQAMSKFSYWIEAFVHRYLRFMPMYLIIFWYTRDVSEYIGFGPLWDYATADTSLRSVCKQESIIVPLAFQANFKPIDQHCVKPAWYLANDYQYLLITPLFMGLIMKSTILGYSVIGVSIAISLILQFVTVFYSTEMNDFEALINFKPMFGAYILKNLWKLYVLPYNRIPPYLIGILTGHLMHNLNKSSQNQGKQISTPSTSLDTKDLVASEYRSRDSLASLKSFQNRTSIIENNTEPMTAILSENQFKKNSNNLFKALGSYLCIKIWIPLLFLISIIYLPMVTRIITQEGLAAKIGTSSLIALMRFIWSLSIARLIYICATRFLENNPIDRSDSFVIRFLSSPKWKPWSKIGLSALLIQWEIISYLAQSQTGAPNMTITLLIAVILVCIITTYSLALLIYLTIEYPLSQIEQLYIHPVFFDKR